MMTTNRALQSFLRLNILVWALARFGLHTSAFAPVSNRHPNARLTHPDAKPFHGSDLRLMTPNCAGLGPRELLFSRSVQLYNFYNSNNNIPPQLPPPRNNGDEWKSIATSALLLGGVIVFFASPLGGIVFTIFNSLLFLSFILPLVGIVAFQVWQAWNTLEGVCPACGAPVRVIKNDATALEATPSLCFSCGSVIQATLDNERIELAAPGSGVRVVEEEPSVWDTWFRGAARPNDIRSSVTTTTTSKADQLRRERTVIDVEAEDT